MYILCSKYTAYLYDFGGLFWLLYAITVWAVEHCRISPPRFLTVIKGN